ncbi:Spy/CpxP family protein refolding chaperone [Neisseriaceae bacterium ESL0693]|nr:Spy/CpxP family protein refolding chaperone [Neisseriaceae bacterium ESL0693]
MVGISLLSTTALAATQTSCDIRKLELTPAQKTKMRLIRVQYRDNGGNFHYASNNNQYNNKKLARILTQPNFEEAQAKRYILERYAERMQQDIDELKVQYHFLQVLNDQQRQSWINHCLR